MNIAVYDSKTAMGAAAAACAAQALTSACAQRGRAAFIAATGASQFEFLAALTADASIDWRATTMFHLDEYVGIPSSHPASFVKYLQERLVAKVHPGIVNLINGMAHDPHNECQRLSALIGQHEIDVAFVGIGENGHLAFNDPPADFDTFDPYLVVELDTACRRQQVGEGWFATLDDVPTHAISMSVRQIMKARAIVCTVPDERKARAVQACFGTDDVSPLHPASILKRHPRVHVFLDTAAASLLPHDAASRIR